MTLRVAELEVLIGTNTVQVDQAETKVKATGKRIEGKPITAKVDGDAKGAIAAMDRVTAEAKKIVSQRTMATVDANIERAEKSFIRVKERLDYLRSVETEMEVTADIKRAETSMQRVERQLQGLRSAKATMEVDLDTAPVEAGFRRAKDLAGDAGQDAGDEFSGEIVAALLSIPIAGAVIGIGVAAGKALISGFKDGLGQEQSRDRIAALTGIDEADALRFARASAEAYANTFGESIEANMNTARLALQFDLIDDDDSTAAAQSVIESLTGIADVLEQDVARAAQAVTVLLRTGMAKNAKEAFDIIATGAREGVDRGEDMLDTFIEYPSVLKKLGLSGQEMLGLLNQSLEAGARNSDFAADALKEFQIRATDASELSAAGFQRLGLNAEEMTAKIAAGGEGARAGLQIVLDRLRETEDPVRRNAAAVELFGTKAEDLGDSLFAMDLSSAVKELDGVTGAADRMFAAISDNDATRVERAQRNIEVAVDGINAALASAFSDPLGDFADWVAANRGPLLQFLADLVNEAIDFGISATESFGGFVSGPLADTVEGIASVIDVMNGFEGRPKELDALAEQMRGVDDTTDDMVGRLRDMKAEFSGFADGQIAMGYLNDASLRLADAVDRVGSKSGTMETQVRGAIAAISDQVDAADDAGESQTQLADRYKAGTDALVAQMVQSGLTEDAARALIDQVLKTPAEKSTQFNSNAVAQQEKVEALADRIDTLPDGTVVITANVDPAYASVRRLIRDVNGTVTQVRVGSTIAQASGGILEFMAGGGLTPMAPVAQTVPANTWRVVGDRSDVSEAYIPLDGSARSRAILAEANARMPGGGGTTRVLNYTVNYPVARDPERELWEAAQTEGVL